MTNWIFWRDFWPFLKFLRDFVGFSPFHPFFTCLTMQTFYTIPVIVLLVSKPSLYRLNWTSWRLRNNRLLWNAYCNLLKHILSKHNRHQYKIMIHRWLCLILCQRKFIFQNNWKIINTNIMSTNSFFPFFGYFWQVFIGAYWYKHIILC